MGNVPIARLRKLLHKLCDVVSMFLMLACYVLLPITVVGGIIGAAYGAFDFLSAPIGFKRPIQQPWTAFAFFGGGIATLASFGLLYLVLRLQEFLDDT